MTRKLASIRKIASIEPIANADKLELAHIDGWQVVVQKDTHKVGDLVVYFEIDSFLPVRPEFEFLRKSCFRSTKHLGDGFKIRTIKLRGTLSQGLIIPVKDFLFPVLPEEGMDVTEILGVQKWEQPISPNLAGIARGNFPDFIRKTDQERVQNLYNKLQYKHKDDRFVATMKLDGSSMTVYWKDGKFGVCSRNLDLEETEDNTFWKVARKLNLEAAMTSYGRNIAIQGELMGPGVQGNREGLKDHDFYVFAVWNIDEQTYEGEFEQHDTIFDMIRSGADLKTVPYISNYIPSDHSLEELLGLAKIPSLNHKVAEGIVLRSLTNPNFSFKIINNDFLLGEKD